MIGRLLSEQGEYAKFQEELKVIAKRKVRRSEHMATSLL